MSNIEVLFDLNNGKIGATASINFLGEETKKDINITDLGNFWKMACIEHKFNAQHKLSFNWKLYNNWEQFIVFDEYKIYQDKKLMDINYQPWTTFAQWSHIANPSKGTLQTNKVYRTVYKSNGFTHKFPKVNDIIVTIKNPPIGDDWDTKNYIKGYWY